MPEADSLYDQRDLCPCLLSGLNKSISNQLGDKTLRVRFDHETNSTKRAVGTKQRARTGPTERMNAASKACFRRCMAKNDTVSPGVDCHQSDTPKALTQGRKGRCPN